MVIEENEFTKKYINDPDADVYDLDVTPENFEILLKRIETLTDFYALQRIFHRFKKYLTPEIKKKVLSDAKKMVNNALNRN
jgi:hypothetical protein